MLEEEVWKYEWNDVGLSRVGGGGLEVRFQCCAVLERRRVGVLGRRQSRGGGEEPSVAEWPRRKTRVVRL